MRDQKLHAAMAAPDTYKIGELVVNRISLASMIYLEAFSNPIVSMFNAFHSLDEADQKQIRFGTYHLAEVIWTCSTPDEELDQYVSIMGSVNDDDRRKKVLTLSKTISLSQMQQIIKFMLVDSEANHSAQFEVISSGGEQKN